MGKRQEYTARPKRPLAAKVVWDLFEEKRGKPDRMYYDFGSESWVALYGETKVLERELR